MTRSCLGADYGTYPEQDIKHTGLDQETQYFACQCRRIAIEIIAYQRLAIFPLARRALCVIKVRVNIRSNFIQDDTDAPTLGSYDGCCDDVG
jgi:hypothetical protein